METIRGHHCIGYDCFYFQLHFTGSRLDECQDLTTSSNDNLQFTLVSGLATAKHTQRLITLVVVGIFLSMVRKLQHGNLLINYLSIKLSKFPL